jgi:sugar phosphate isomerase/epimerase
MTMRVLPIALQLYSLREQAAKDVRGVLKGVADIGYAGVEFAGFHGLTPAELKKALDALGLVATSSHGALPSKENVKEIVQAAGTLGYTHHVVSWGPDSYATREKTLETAAKLQEAAALLRGTGIKLSYHNHWWEFENKFAGKSGHQLLMENAPDLLAQIDTYWVAVGGGDPAKVLREVGSRAPLLHIKDGSVDRQKAHLAVGAGKMNWREILAAASPAAEWLIVELDSCDTDMWEAVRQSYGYLTANAFAKGKK